MTFQMKSKLTAGLLGLLCVQALNILQPNYAFSQTSALGTRDSGGGAGLRGRVLETYSKDPVISPELRAYTEIVEPLLLKVLYPVSNLTGSEKTARDEDDLKNLRTLVRMKTWYLTPEEVLPVDFQTLGILVKNQETLARQSRDEIWIDEMKFFADGVSLADQGDLILHEFVMMLYMQKFETMETVCIRITSSFKEAQPACDFIKALSPAGTSFEPAIPRPLNEQDNSRIRRVTSWIKNLGNDPKSRGRLLEVLVQNGFDQRIYRPLLSASEISGSTAEAAQDPQRLLVSYDDIEEAIIAMSSTNSELNKCKDLGSDFSQSCISRLNITGKQATENANGTATLDIRIAQINQEELQFKLQAFSEGPTNDFGLWKLGTVHGKSYYVLSLIPQGTVFSQVIGSAAPEAKMIFGYELDGYNLPKLTLKALMIENRVLTRPYRMGENNVYTGFRSRALRHVNPFDTGVILTGHHDEGVQRMIQLLSTVLIRR